MSKNYVLSIPLGPGHWLSVTSNKAMEAKHFLILDRYLALQKEICADDPTGRRDSDRSPEGGDGATGSIEDESAGLKGIAQGLSHEGS